MRTEHRAPRVGAVVLNWCGEEDTAACVRSLQASDYPSLDVFLVDNGSPDGSGERLHARFPELEYVQTGENLGYAAGNNRGITRALELGCDYLLVLNNDTVVEPDCVSRLVGAARSRPRVGAVGAKILYYDDPARVWFAGGDFSRMRAVGFHRLSEQLDPDPAGGEIEEVSFLTGCCLLVPAEVIRTLGGLEEDFFMYVEDVEFSVRLVEAGMQLLYEPRARILHRVPVREPAPSAAKILLRDRNRRRLVRRRYEAADQLRFVTFFYPTRLLLALRYLASGDRERAGAILRGMVLP